MKYKTLSTVALGVMLVLLSGCEDNKTPKYLNATVKCSDEQLLMLQKQYKICSQTGYFDTYCYDQARVEQCDIIRDDVKHK